MTKQRTCRECGRKQALTLFPVAGIIKGVAYYRHLCQRCYMDVKAARRRKIHDWYKQLKQGLRCQHCPNNDYRVLEFHHRGSKRGDVADMVKSGYSKETILAEIAKCDCLCANCHRILTYDERRSVV